MTLVIDRHSTRASAALQSLVEFDPAIAALSLWCEHRDGHVTRTHGDVITYGPDFEERPLHEQRGIAAHHIMHVALRHSLRLSELDQRLGSSFDSGLYNLVADALVNEALLMADHALPRPAVTLSELVSRALGKRVTPEAALTEWDVDRLYFALKGDKGEGSAAAERASAYAGAQEFAEDVDRTGGASENPDEDSASAARWRQHLTRAMDAGRQAGRGIGASLIHLADIPEPRIPWEILLRRLLSGAVTFTPQPDQRRPSRRWVANVADVERRGVQTPGFEPGSRPYREVPKVAIGVDTSSSVDEARLHLFWSEITGIARRTQAELHLLIFDHEIRHRQRIDPSQTHVKAPGFPRGGGTAFLPVIDEAAQIGADALVMLTDLEGPTGASSKGLKVFWVVPQPPPNPPPFGNLINMLN